jgi:starvation-inducible outer membrane lipoprotein
MIKKTLLLIFIALLVSSCTNPPTIQGIDNDPSTVNIFSSPERYVDEEVKFTAYVHNVISVCQASSKECWGKPVISPNSVYDKDANIQVLDASGKALAGCESTEEPCQGFIDGQRYLITGVLVKTEEQVINGKNLFNEIAVKVISKELN